MAADESGIEPRKAVSGGSVSYTPAVPGNWSPAPSTIGDALDQIAARVVALEASAPVAQTYSCPSGATARQLVYLSGSGAVDLADASNTANMPALGFIASKPTSTTCTLADEDELSGFVGLTPQAVYYADPATPGGITTTLPDVTVGNVVQQVGVAKTATILKIEISTPAPVNP